ncbi:MAG: RNase adapter RapZ, partial [Eubacteriales bacterium]|nr:RNase adapter RapZ [Eubacteriales bacterium]
MSFYIVSGMSGAGKTVALKTLEDMGYYCVDNLPVFLIPQFSDLLTDSKTYTKVAVGVDIRSGEALGGLSDVIDGLDKKNIKYDIIFLDASDSVLLKRYKETRRNHPLSKNGTLAEGIEKERQELRWLKDRADYVIDTSNLLSKELRSQLENVINEGKNVFKNLVLTVMSFGFKYGIPQDADLVFDVRFLPNPYYVEGLRQKTGLDSEVYEYVMNHKESEEFYSKLSDLIDFLLPKYVSEGKNSLVIAIGCTGGKHRSVAVTE